MKCNLPFVIQWWFLETCFPELQDFLFASCPLTPLEVYGWKSVFILMPFFLPQGYWHLGTLAVWAGSGDRVQLLEAEDLASDSFGLES